MSQGDPGGLVDPETLVVRSSMRDRLGQDQDVVAVTPGGPTGGQHARNATHDNPPCTATDGTSQDTGA